MAGRNGSANPTPVRRRILDHLGATGDVQTDEQIAEAIGEPRSTTVSRRSELARDGWVEQRGQRTTRSGSTAAAWVLTADGRASWEAGEEQLPDTELTEDEALALIGRRATGFVRRLYLVIGEQGKMTDAEMRVALGSKGSGPSNALPILREAGLVRHAGRANTRGKKAQQYEQTPRLQRRIDAQKAKYATEEAKAKPGHRSRTLAGARLPALRRMEPGEFSEWQRVRKRVMEQTVLLTQVEYMAFWEAVPDDELEWVLEEILENILWGEAAALAILQRQVDDGTRGKIEKMLGNLSGRSEGEIENARSLAAKLRKKLPS